jgi:uracil-DNA glycosylase
MTLNLDPRQRAILAEMGIRTWSADAPQGSEAAAKAKKQEFIDNLANVSVKPPFNATKNSANTGTGTGPGKSANRHAQAPAEQAAQPSAANPASMQAARAALVAAAPAPAAPLVFTPSAEHAAAIASLNWPELAAKAASCQACTLCEARKSVVFGAGPFAIENAAPQADWLIVGDPPGEDEDASGQPFAGPAGKLLDNMLRAMRANGQWDGAPLSRASNAFLTSPVLCRPPASRNPSAQELAQCAPYLQRQIALIQPKIILALGRFAIAALTGSTEPLGRLRGKVLACTLGGTSIPVIASYHPSVLLRSPAEKAKAWDDMLLAMQTLREQSV